MGQVDSTRRAAVSQATGAWSDLVHSRDAIISYRAQIQSFEVALEGVKHQAEIGLKIPLDVLNAQDTVYQARGNLMRARHDELASEYLLASTVGRLFINGMTWERPHTHN